MVESDSRCRGLRGSKPALSTGSGFGSHLTSPIRRMPGFWMTKTLETDTDNCQVLDYRTLEREKIGRFVYIQTNKQRTKKKQTKNKQKNLKAYPYMGPALTPLTNLIVSLTICFTLKFLPKGPLHSISIDRQDFILYHMFMQPRFHSEYL